jgi:hypothetical protein
VFLLTAHRASGRADEVMASSYGLLDLTAYGRQELWEDSPEGWPQRWVPKVASSGWTGVLTDRGCGGVVAATPHCGRGCGRSGGLGYGGPLWPGRAVRVVLAPARAVAVSSRG